MDKKIKEEIYYLSLECAYKYKIAIPRMVADNLVKKYPEIEIKEAIEKSRKYCQKVNKMNDKEIESNLKKEVEKKQKKS